MWWLNRKEDIELWTRKNPFERFPNGRPCVPDAILERMKQVSVEEAWGVLKGHGYNHQYEGNWLNIHPDQVMVGRAVTAAFVHTRPDMHEVVEEWGKAQGSIGLHNAFVIDTLVENDVLVVDLFGKIKEGTFAGDNLGTAIANKTRTGMIIDGGIRDLARLREIEDFGIFVRGFDATGIAETTLLSLNAPNTRAE